MEDHVGGLRWLGPRACVAAALLVAALVVVACDDDEGPVERVAFLADGTVVAESMSVKAALEDASERVGFDVRVPRDLPNEWMLRTISAQSGPVGQLATLFYRADDGHLLEVTQMAPERSVSLAAGGSPRDVDPGAPGVDAAVIQSTGKTTLSWDSNGASYLAVYVYPDESWAAEAEAFLVGLFKSMK
jgi:hypothetical protein